MDTKKLIEKVNEFCKEQSEPVTTIEKNYIINKILENINATNEDGKKSSRELDKIMESLLTDSNLTTNLSAANGFYRKYLSAVQQDLNTKNNHRFWTSVFTNILASFFYSILVALIIWLGRDQLGNFINSLFNK